MIAWPGMRRMGWVRSSLGGSVASKLVGRSTLAARPQSIPRIGEAGACNAPALGAPFVGPGPGLQAAARVRIAAPTATETRDRPSGHDKVIAARPIGLGSAW